MIRFCGLWCFLYVAVLCGSWEWRPGSGDDFVEMGFYEAPVDASGEAWEAVQGYLLPYGDPLRGELDRIFGASRVTADEASLREAGFTLTPDQGLHVFVASHKRLKGYLIKVVLDKDTPNTAGKGADWEHWIRRIEGERVIRQGISDLGYKKYFKVPRQWIYPLPVSPRGVTKSGYTPKGFILVVEDMKLEPKDMNTLLYRTMKYKYLEMIYRMTTKYGLSDCCNKHNLPWCRDGKMAFVDTESFHRWPVDYHRMIEFLSTDGRVYWKKLRDQGGPR